MIEIDSAQHFTQQGKIYDAERTNSLEKYGICVLRFTNSNIDDNFDGVCKMIDKTIKKRIDNKP